MRIVYVLTSLGMGGAERQVVEVATRMEKRGHTVTLLALRPRLEEEWPTSLDVVHLEMRRTPLSVWKGMARGRAFLRESRPDLIHSHCFHANIAARLLKFFVPATPVLSTVHNVYEGGWPRMLAYALTDRLSARTTAVSHAAARRFVKLRAIPGHKCIVLSNAIDTVEFAPNPERRTQMRAEMGVDAEFIWLTAGRIVQAKDIPNLLRSFARVRASLPDAQLWIAGEAIGAEKYRMRGLSAVLGVADAVQWLGLRRDLPSLLDAADGFVLASAWEGMPLAVGEAMAMEKPVVATDVGGVRELVGSAGLIVPRKDPTALGDGMIEIMRKPSEERQALGQAARSRIRSNFDMDIRVEDWEALYNAVLESR